MDLGDGRKQRRKARIRNLTQRPLRPETHEVAEKAGWDSEWRRGTDIGGSGEESFGKTEGRPFGKTQGKPFGRLRVDILRRMSRAAVAVEGRDGGHAAAASIGESEVAKIEG